MSGGMSRYLGYREARGKGGGIHVMAQRAGLLVYKASCHERWQNQHRRMACAITTFGENVRDQTLESQHRDTI